MLKTKTVKNARASCASESVTEENFWGNEAREFRALQTRAWMTDNLSKQKTKYSGGQTS
jgi:hypothetical protein